jgi:hypothetical protein
MENIPRGLSQEDWKFLGEKLKKEDFIASSRYPLRWIIAARGHKRAADILYQIASKAIERRTLEGKELEYWLDAELLPDYFLLAGYALECILKGFLLATHPEYVKNEETLAKSILTHDLADLCKLCTIPVPPEKSKYLDYLTKHLYWGKYPVPTKLENMPNPLDDNFPGISSAETERLKEFVDKIYEKGFAMLNAERESSKEGNFTEERVIISVSVP